MVALLEPSMVRHMLSDEKEIALVDVRENGQFGDGHPFFAVSVPYSKFEARIIQIAPGLLARIVLYDNDDGIAHLAATCAVKLGYTDVYIMKGGAGAWKAAGYFLYKGENVPSKTFGELLEAKNRTPRLKAEQLEALKCKNANHIVVDSRPYAEYNEFNIPGGVCCPNGELPLRIGELVSDPKTTIVVNCAGRTRSILGTETLRAFGIPNPVFALENGTQGWFLAGFEREEGADRSYPEAPKSETKLAVLRSLAAKRAAKTGLRYIEAEEAATWLADTKRTTYLFDVRTEEEFKSDGIPGSRHVLGGQLVQATDLWIGVRGSRSIIMDNEMIRAPMMANWIHQIGYEVAILNGGVDAMRGVTIPDVLTFKGVQVSPITPESAKRLLEVDGALCVDLRPILSYRRGHIEGATWSIRPRLGQLGLNTRSSIVLVAEDDKIAALATQRLRELGITSIQRITGDEDKWQAAGLKVVASPNEPDDSDCIELLFHWHQRNQPNGGDREAALAYIAWEINLVDQLDQQERSSFRLAKT